MPRSMQEILDHSEEEGTARVVDPGAVTQLPVPRCPP
jgi:hypothetical protein